VADQRTTIMIEGQDNASAEIGKAATSLRGLAELAGGGLLSAGFVKAAKGLENLAVESASIERIRVAFNNLTASANQNGDAILAAMQKAAKGTVGEHELMMTANRAMMMMGAEMADKFPKMLEYAKAAAGATGRSMDDMFQTILYGIGRVSPRMLATAGIVLDLGKATEEYARSVGKTASELSKEEQQQALWLAASVKMDAQLKNLGSGSNKLGDAVKQLNVRWNEFKEGIGTKLIPAASLATDVISKLLKVLESPVGSTAITVFGSLATIIAGVVGPVLLLDGALKLLRTTGFLEVGGLIANLGKWAAYSVIQLGAAAGATTTLAAAELGATIAAKAMWVAVTGPVGIAVALIGGLVALLAVGKKSADAMAESAKTAGENLKAALATPENNRTAEQLKAIAKEADLATMRLQLLKDARDRLTKESLDPGSDQEITRLNQQIAELESRIRYLNGEWETWNSTIDMTREKWRGVAAEAKNALANLIPSGSLGVTVGMNLSPLAKDSYDLQGYLKEWKAAQDKATADNTAYFARTHEQYNADVKSAEDWLGRIGQTYGGMVAAKQSLVDQLAVLDAQSVASAINAAAQYGAGTDVLQKSFEENQKALWEAGQKYIAELRAKGRGEDAKQAETDLKAEIEQNAKDHDSKMKARKEQYAYEQDLAKWNQSLQYAEAQLAYARSQKAAVDNMNAELAIYMMGKGANADEVIKAFGLQDNAQVMAAVKTAEYKNTFTTLMDQVGLSASQAAIAVAASANAQAAALAGAGGSVEYWLGVIAKLYETKPFKPDEGETIDLNKYRKPVEAGGAGNSEGVAKAFNSAATESAASVTRDLAAAIEGARAAAESLVGFSMPSDADTRFKNLETFLDKAVNAVYNVMSKVGGKLINIRGSIKYIAELANAIVELNRALMSMVVAKNLPDLTAWGKDADKMIEAAMGVVERAEAAYGAGRIIKAGNLAKFIGQLTGGTGGGNAPQPAGNTTINITVNGGNGSPADIANAVKGALTQAGMLKAARARGVA
jgi:hypothetical protein